MEKACLNKKQRESFNSVLKIIKLSKFLNIEYVSSRKRTMFLKLN